MSLTQSVKRHLGHTDPRCEVGPGRAQCVRGGRIAVHIPEQQCIVWQLAGAEFRAQFEVNIEVKGFYFRF